MEFNDAKFDSRRVRQVTEVASVRSAARRGQRLFSDRKHGSEFGEASGSVSRGEQNHLQGNSESAPVTDNALPQHSEGARKERRSMNLSPKPNNKTKFDA